MKEMSQQDMGKYLGLSDRTVRRREAGVSKWTDEEIARIAKLEGLPAKQIKIN